MFLTIIYLSTKSNSILYKANEKGAGCKRNRKAHFMHLAITITDFRFSLKMCSYFNANGKYYFRCYN